MKLSGYLIGIVLIAFLYTHLIKICTDFFKVKRTCGVFKHLIEKITA